MVDSPFYRFKREVELKGQNLSLAFSGERYIPLPVIEQALQSVHLSNQTPPESANHESLFGWAILSLYGHTVEHLLSSTVPVSSAVSYWDDVLHSGPMGLTLYMIQATPSWVARQVRQQARTRATGNWRPLASMELFQTPLFIKLRPKSYQELVYIANPGYAAVKRSIKDKRDQAKQIKRDIATRLGTLVNDSFKGDSMLETVSRTAAVILKSLDDDPELLANQEQHSASSIEETRAQLLQIAAILNSELGNQNARNQLKQCGKPSRLFRYWPAGVVALYGLYKFVGNLPALIEWIQTTVFDTLQSFWENWIVSPLRNVYETVRHDDQAKIALMSKQSLASDMSSLERMVIEFSHDYDRSNISDDIIRERVQSGDMSAVLIPYEKQIQTPISSLLRGQLVRSLLIQIQKTKVDVEVAMDGIDKLLQSQQLVFGLVAAIPAIAVTWFATKSLVNRSQQGNLRKKAHDRGETKDRLLLSLGEIEQILFKYVSSDPNSLTNLGLGLVLCETHFVKIVAKDYLSKARYRQLCRDLQALEMSPTWTTLDRIYLHGYFN